MMTVATLERLLIVILVLVFLLVGLIAGGKIKAEVIFIPPYKKNAQYNPNDDYFKVGPSNPYALQPTALTFAGIVTIQSDGKIIYHTGYTPDIAARTMWEAVGKYFGERSCKK